MPRTVEFFFDYTSPYSYLASTQIEGVAARCGATLSWRPFFLAAVFKATENSSPALNFHKARYLLKDLEEWTRHYRLPPLVFPSSFPANSLLADRLGVVASREGKVAQFTHALYRRVFVRGDDPADPTVLGEALTEVGLEPAASLAQAQSSEVKDQAVARGAFGAPAFFVGDSMFIGNDRLTFVEQALKPS